MGKTPPVLELMGVPGSPYTRKMLALMRYRRIPYRLLPGSKFVINEDKARFRARPQARVPLLPTYYLKDAEGREAAVTDSSPLIRRFENEYQGRSVIPAEPVLAFIDFLIEDYADEWLTKAMFHYRWSYQADIKKAGQLLPRWSNQTATDKALAQRSKTITELQISRLSYVGSNEVTAATIEESFKRFIHLLDNHLKQQHFLLGERPSSCDFAIYGQLTCLALFDPTPQAIVLAEAPRVYAWTEVMEDLSGYELLDGDWISTARVPVTLQSILLEIGRIYAPYLLTNAEAVRAGKKQMEMELDGRPWQQKPFPYQLKCLNWIQQEYGKLNQNDKNTADALLTGTGLENLLKS